MSFSKASSCIWFWPLFSWQDPCFRVVMRRAISSPWFSSSGICSIFGCRHICSNYSPMETCSSILRQFRCTFCIWRSNTSRTCNGIFWLYELVSCRSPFRSTLCRIRPFLLNPGCIFVQRFPTSLQGRNKTSYCVCVGMFTELLPIKAPWRRLMLGSTPKNALMLSKPLRVKFHKNK